MREFFRGWKRKMGCVTLLLACVFAAAWVRSLTTYDFLTTCGKNTEFRINSAGSSIRLVRRPPSNPRGVTWTSGQLDSLAGFRLDENGKRETYDRWKNYNLTWNWDFPGFHFGGGTLKGRGTDYGETYEIYYIWIVLPLTLLSAYLLLSKPRPPKPTKEPPV